MSIATAWRVVVRRGILPGVATLTALGLLTVWLGAARSAHAADFDVACDTDALIAAITTANGNGEADTLALAPACIYDLTTSDNDEGGQGNNGLPPVMSTITISGNGATIQRDLAYVCPSGVEANDFHFFYVSGGGGDLMLQNLTLRNGCGNSGGAIMSSGRVTLTASTLLSNTAGSGAGIFNLSGEVTLIDSAVISNSTANGAGGIYNVSGPAIISGSVIMSNTARFGGGIINESGSMTITGSVLLNNHSSGDAGGIYNNGGKLTLIGSDVMRNRAFAGGGILQVGASSVLTITASRLLRNQADEGSFLRFDDGDATIGSSCIAGNSNEAILNPSPEERQVGASDNWWGADDGPGPVGPGNGDQISEGVNFAPFLSEPPTGMDCPPRLSELVFLPAMSR